MLVIACEFHSEKDRDVFLGEFEELAKYVVQNEPDTLAYETAVADNNPLKVLIYERSARQTVWPLLCLSLSVCRR